MSSVDPSNLLSEPQSAALWACYQGESLAGHVHEDVQALVKLGYVLNTAVGTVITDSGSDHLLMYGRGVGQPLGILSWRYHQ